ncbi:MAG TPA: RsmE family RNA methyltransferase [Trueperaceae bacterium]|nr:RsmE family RNA methyltransferase [Trueperaceae bacterium]
MRRKPGTGRRVAGVADVQRAWSTTGARVERIDRVLVDDLDEVTLVTGPEAHHLRDVLRVKVGSVVEAFDGRGSYARGQVVAADKDGVTLSLGEAQVSSAEPEQRVTIAVALLKGDKLVDVVRPATELGVKRFVTFVSTNCEARELSAAKLSRLRRVAQEAARQSGRSVVPTVEEPVELTGLELSGTVIVGDPASSVGLAEHLDDLLDSPEVTFLTGPEGGLTEAEVHGLVEAGALGVRLGPRVLRADTAPVAMVAALLLIGGR